MNKILITGGPTNEFIDEVMKITNMSTGQTSMKLAENFSERGWQVCLVINKNIDVSDLDDHIKIIAVETTDDMLNALKEETSICEYDVIVHAAAVGDYKTDFTFLMEDLAEEIFEYIAEIETPQQIYDILTDPECKISHDSKISSYQSDLTVKLTLTPKIIKELRSWYPNSMIIGCKLLENVSKDELYDVAKKLCIRNEVDYILANDLAELRKGHKQRYLVDKDGFTGIELADETEITKFIESKVEKQ